MSSTALEVVSVALSQDGETLMLKRDEALADFPGHFGFPGGKVDAAEREEALGEPTFAHLAPRLVPALLRALREELALDLVDLLHRGELLRIDPLGTALTWPGPEAPQRAHFFVVELRTRPRVGLDPAQAESAGWARPAQWSARYERGELLLAPPTAALLQRLTAAETAEPASAAAAASPAALVQAEPLGSLRLIYTPSNTIRPAMHTNCFVIGQPPARRIAVDPSPASETVLAQLIEALAAGGGIDEVFITHHHPDHREHADALARRFGVPLGMSAYTEDAIRRRDPGFFRGLAVRHYREGEVLTHWLGQPVRVLEVPGHDEGQLALMPDNRAWCIVGDLIQTTGTVVIPKPEGNMRKYFASLRRIIELAPRVVFPSHGVGAGGTHRLRQTLAHREQREAAVLALHREGFALDGMLAAVYPGLPAELAPLARMNLEGHLEKLQEEGRL